MRRRDANASPHFDRTRDTWRALVSLALSLTLHAGLVAVATILVVRASARPVIQVSLLTGKDNQKPGGVSSADAPAPLPPSETAYRDPAPQQSRLDQVRAHGPQRPSHAIAETQQTESVAEDAAPRMQPVAAAAESGILSGANRPGGEPVARLSGTGSGHAAGSGTGDGVDPRTYCVYCPEPYYPLIARSLGWQGTVEVALSVLADGSVNGASLGRSSGYPALDEAAIAVARQSRFHLPGDGGLPTPLRGRMEYRFVLR